jgi:hypothetical protein
VLSRGADRRDLDVFDRDTLDIGELLTQGIALGRHPAYDPMRHRQLLHHEVQMPIECADRRTVLDGFDRLVREFLLAPDLVCRARASLGRAGKVEQQCIGGRGGRFRSLGLTMHGALFLGRVIRDYRVVDRGRAPRAGRSRAIRPVAPGPSAMTGFARGGIAWRDLAIGLRAVRPSHQIGLECTQASRPTPLSFDVRGNACLVGRRGIVGRDCGTVLRRKWLMQDFSLFRLFLNQVAFLPHENGLPSTENDTTVLEPPSNGRDNRGVPRAGEKTILPETRRRAYGPL